LKSPRSTKAKSSKHAKRHGSDMGDNFMTNKAEQVKRVIELIEDGMSEAAACREVKINRATRTTALKVNCW
jgi:hypothetical protein